MSFTNDLLSLGVSIIFLVIGVIMATVCFTTSYHEKQSGATYKSSIVYGFVFLITGTLAFVGVALIS